MEISCSFRLVLEGKTGRQSDTRAIKIRALRKVFSNFVSLDTEDNTNGPLNRENYLYLCWENYCPESHVSAKRWTLLFYLSAYTSLAASRTLLQRLLAYLNLTLNSEDLFCWCKQKIDFYELWQQHKLLKSIEVSEVWPDTYDEGYIPEFTLKILLKPLTKPTWTNSQNS